MKLGQIAMAAALLGAVAVLPAAAQTMQLNPTRPGDSSITQNQAGSAGRQAKPSERVDINTASAEMLNKLPGIGKARADAIVRHRPYQTTDDLVSRHILPPAVYNGIRNDITTRRG